MDQRPGTGLAETFGVDRDSVTRPRIPEQMVPDDDVAPHVHLEERLRAVASINRSILEGGQSDDLLRLFARWTRRLADATLALVLLPEDSGHLTVRAADARDDRVLRNLDLSAHATLAQPVMQTGEALRVADLSRRSLTRDAARTQGLGDAVLLPVRVRAHVVAVIEVATERSGRLLDEHVRALRLFAAQIGLAVETHLSGGVRLFDALSLQARASQVRAEIGELRPAPVEITNLLGQTLDRIAQTVVDLADVDACSIHLLDQDLCLQVAGSSHLPSDLLAELQTADQQGAPHPALEAIASGRPVVVTNERDRMRADIQLADVRDMIRHLPWDAVGSVPLITQGGHRGALCYYFAPARRPDESGQRLVKALAAQAATVVDNSQLLAAANKSVAVEERQHLARELHDSVSQALYGIALGARATLEQLEQDPSRAREPVRYVLQLAETGLAEMRALILELRPEALETEGLAAALVKQADAVRARNGISVDISIEGVPESAVEVHQALYRIGQEALHNAAKHAAARHVTLRLSSDRGHLTLEITDDGIGFDPEASFPGHLGLKSMRERATALGGTLQISSRPGTGTRIRATVPLFPAAGRHAS